VPDAPRMCSVNCERTIYITLAQGYPCATPSVPTGEWGGGTVGLEIVDVRVIPAMWDPLFGAIR